MKILTDFRKTVETGMDPRLALALVFFCAAVFCVIATSFPLGQVSYAVLVCFTVRQKIVSRRIYVNFMVLNLHFKVSYRQQSFTRSIHENVQRKRRALKTNKLTERLKIRTVLFSRLFDLQNKYLLSTAIIQYLTRLQSSSFRER